MQKKTINLNEATVKQLVAREQIYHYFYTLGVGLYALESGEALNIREKEVINQKDGEYLFEAHHSEGYLVQASKIVDTYGTNLNGESTPETYRYEFNSIKYPNCEGITAVKFHELLTK